MAKRTRVRVVKIGDLEYWEEETKPTADDVESHYAAHERCYLKKARLLMAGKDVDPVCNDDPAASALGGFLPPLGSESRSELDRILSIRAQSRRPFRVMELSRAGYDRREIINALRDAGWTEIGRGWWEPPRRKA